MALKRKILCITSAALLSASVYAFAPDNLGDDQASAPTAVGVVNWTAFKTVSLASVCSGGTYWALNEMNRRMNMGIENPYVISAAAMVAAFTLYSGGAYGASVETPRGGPAAVSVADASPSRGYGTVDVKEKLKKLERARGLFSGGKNQAMERAELEEIARTLNNAVTFLQNRKDHYKVLHKNSTEELTVLREKCCAAVDKAHALDLEAARNEANQGRIKDLLEDLARVRQDLKEEQGARSKQQTEAGSAILRLNGDMDKLRKRLDTAQSTAGSMVDPSECAASEAGRSVASTMRRNVETFFGEILEKDEREALRKELEKFRAEKTQERKRAEESSAALAAEAAAAMDDVV